MPKDDEIINAALAGEPNTDEVNYLTLLSSYDGKLTLLQWLKKSVAYYQQGIDQFSADHNQVELNRLNIADLEGRVYTLEQKPACLPLTGGTLNGGLDVMGRLAISGKAGQDPMLEVGEGVADSHLSIQANKSLYSRIFTPTNSAYTFAETMRDGVFEWTIESQSNGETKTATYRLPYGANMPTGNHFLALHDEVTAEATTRNNQIAGLRDAVTGVNNALLEEVTNRENADNANSQALNDFKAQIYEGAEFLTNLDSRVTIHHCHAVKIFSMVFLHVNFTLSEDVADRTGLFNIPKSSGFRPAAGHGTPAMISNNAVTKWVEFDGSTGWLRNIGAFKAARYEMEVFYQGQEKI